MSDHYPKNIQEAQEYLSQSVLALFFIFLAIILLLWSIVFAEAHFNKKYLLEQQLNADVILYKTNLSEKLGIIASSSVFVNYIRSGEKTREDLYTQFLSEILTLKEPSIIGMEIDYIPSKYLSGIETNQPKNIFSYGEKSKYYVTLPLCYLNDKIDFNYGICEQAWTLYFSKFKMITALKKVNKSIGLCLGKFCKPLNLLEGKQIGSFPVQTASSLNVKLEVRQAGNYLIYVTLILTPIFLVILILLIRNKAKNIVYQIFADPLHKITCALRSGHLHENKGYIEELQYLNNQIKDYFEEKDKIEIAKIASQAAHDIRSPLSALNTVLKDIPELPETKRILIRNAVRRIGDIANNLLWQYKTTKNGNASAESWDSLSPELVSSILDSLVSEKRVQMAENCVELVLDVDDNAQGCFVKLNANEFKRVISNLINNAAESIESKGRVRIVLNKAQDDLIIKIIDNGKGIPEEILPKIKEGGSSIGKKEGSGLGIAGAILNIKKWSGDYDIQSKVGEGTTFIITLPIHEASHWFQAKIEFLPQTHIVILDDDESIHNIWEMHFQEYLKNGQIVLRHFYKPADLIKYCNNQELSHHLFLIDYELIGFNETGLDLIEELNLKDRAILVTSRYEEPEIRERAKKLHLKIIPKNYAPYIPISEAKPFEQPELILIDDDRRLTRSWELRASQHKKKIAAFNHTEDFKKFMSLYNKDIPIYIDSTLAEAISGQEFAKFLYDQGFHVLYLATGYDSHRFGDMPWIKKIVGKEPPF